MYVTEFTADHIKSSYFDGLSITTPDPLKKGTLNLTMSLMSESSSESSNYEYFVKKGVQLDITNSLLTEFADSTYSEEVYSATSGSDVNPESKSPATLAIDAGLKELTISYPRCGLKYFIDVQSITTAGSMPLLKGQVVDSVIKRSILILRLRLPLIDRSSRQ
jgi:hypothetical protein